MRFILRTLKQCLPDRSPLRIGWHHTKAFCAAVRYGFPAKKLTVIGITGTDGKTTTVNMVGHILRSAGRSVGTVSTTEFRIGDDVELNATQKTSMNPFLLQHYLRRMVDVGCEFAVIEASSHGLVQGRVHHLYPGVAAITNTSAEHLDYHKSLEQYRRDKGKLFRALGGRGTKVLNGADDSFALYKEIPSAETIVYNAPETDLWVTNAEVTPTGSCAMLHTDLGGAVELVLSVPGVFNLENALCAIGCALPLGIPLETCIASLKSFSGVPGRLEKIDEGQGFAVYVDFTVTPAAYEKTLSTLRASTREGKRLLVLASSCGNRMPEKRPEIGRVCSAFADDIILTSDETYGESHEKIISEIQSGADQRKVTIVPDRRQAIEIILREAGEGDTVAICGMAGVTTMMTSSGQIPWDEAAIVRDILRSL